MDTCIHLDHVPVSEPQSLFQIQTVKQTNSVLKEKLGSGVDEFRLPEVTAAT